MSGDITRQRRKEKKKQKRDSVDQQALFKRLNSEEDEAPVPGIDTSKFNESEKKSVQMHVQDSHHDHGAGLCAKVIFFTLMAILLGLVGLIVFENRGGSDVDTPLSESRFSEYLQGWVEETRPDDHHDEPAHFSPEHDDHDDEEDHHEEEEEVHHSSVDAEPYPEEKDVSNADDNEDNESQELNAEINLNDSDQQEQRDSQEQEDDDDDDDNDDNNNNNEDNNDTAEEQEEAQTKENDDDDDDDENKSGGADDENDDDETTLFENSQPFDEELVVKSDHLDKQVNELYDTFNEIAEMLGKDKLDTNKNEHIKKREAFDTKKDDDDDDVSNKETDENIIDNDAGEDDLLQKLAEENENAKQQKQEDGVEDGQADEEESSSLLVKLGVGILLALVAHQIIIKKISATNRHSEEEEIIIKTNEELLNKRRFTMLSNSENEEDIDNEEIIEVMMVPRPNVEGSEGEEEYTDSEELEDEELMDEEFSEEIADEYTLEVHDPQVPETFEQFQSMYRPSVEEESKRKVTFSEPQDVEQEIEEEVEDQIRSQQEKSNVNFSTSVDDKLEDENSPPIEDYDYEPDIDEGEDEEDEELGEEEEEEPLGEEVIDEEEYDYDESEEDLSDVDDDELLKRLEAKYGKISDKANEEETDDASWTKIPEGGAQSYMEELLRHEKLEENPLIKELYEKAKSLDLAAEKEKSNKRLIEAIENYKDFIETYGDKVNDTIFKEIAERCIDRMRFIGKLKQAVDVHYKLVRRFVMEPFYRNQLAVTYLLGNRLSAAKLVLHEVLSQWRYNGFALVHYGFILKNLDQDYENAVLYLREGIDTEEEGTQDGRFYFNLGDALQRLGRNDEAKEIYERGAKRGLFLSAQQRSLYNVNRLKSKPFWTKVQTTYKDELMEIQKYWQLIRDEGLKLLSKDGFFKNEQENLKDVGDWKQFELFARGQKTKDCKFAPITCKVISNFKAAADCTRGQVKFSVLHPNTHIHSHCGPTNCRIRAHLGLIVPKNTFLRVADETRSWKEGEWLIFDDSYEHEVWHNGTSLRLVLLVDVWHPELSEDERKSLSPI